MRSSPQEIRPRNGDTLVVGIVARISGGPSQKELSLDDQVDHGKETVAEKYDGPAEYRTIAEVKDAVRIPVVANRRHAA